MGKPKRNVSTASNGDNDELRNIVITAMTDEHVISTIADKVANVISEKFEKRFKEYERNLGEKDRRIGELEASVSRMEERVDQQEQYSRRTSIRVSGIKEPVGIQGEDVSRIVETILGKLNADLLPLTLADVNVAHRVGQRGSANEPLTRPRPIIVQFKCYASKVSVMRSRKQLRETMPDIYINEDLTRARAMLLYKARKAKREKGVADCWSFDGRIIIKDVRGKVHTIVNEVELAALCG